MDTIKNYLDNMFMNMPKDERVLQAKNELLNMMEDKYNELKSEGKTENEAIGIVISEFGNIEEVVKELEIGSANNAHDKDAYDNQGTYDNQGIYEGRSTDYNKSGRGYDLEHTRVNMQLAKEYIEVVKDSGKKIAHGVTLCILSPILLIVLGGWAENGSFSENSAGAIGVAVLLVLVAIAVAIFIINGIRFSKYEYLQKNILDLDDDVNQYLRNDREDNRGRFAVSITVGVVMCIIAVIPVVFFGSLYENDDFYACISVGIMLAIVSVAVYVFIVAGLNWGTYNVLLQEEDYTKRKKEGHDTIDIVAGVYWPVVVCIYLASSFITGGWGYTWIIWPVAGVLFGAIAAICSAISRN